MVEFRTTFDASVTQYLQKRNFKKLSWVLWIFTVLMVYLGVMSMMSEEPDYVMGVIMILLGLLYIPIIKWISKWAQKKANQSMPLMSETTEEVYQFGMDKATIVQTKGDNYRAVVETGYQYFHKVIETPTHYLFYISNAQTHVIPKDKLAQGTLEEMEDILKANFDERTWIKKKK